MNIQATAMIDRATTTAARMIINELSIFDLLSKLIPDSYRQGACRFGLKCDSVNLYAFRRAKRILAEPAIDAAYQSATSSTESKQLAWITIVLTVTFDNCFRK